MKRNKKLCVSNEHSRGCLTFMNDLPSWKQYHPRQVVDRRQCRCTLHQRPTSCSSNALISASRDCAVDVQLWLVILPNNFDLPKYMCSACADTQRDVGKMLPVSAQRHVQAVFVDCTVAPSAAAHLSCVGLRIKARRESVPTPCTRMRTVRSCNCKSPAAQSGCETTNFCL